VAKRFKFRAETILQLRQQREHLRLRKLAEAQRRVSATQETLRRLRAEMDAQDAQVRDGVLTGAVDVQYMGLYRRYVMLLHARMIEDVRQLRTEAAQLQRCRADVIEAVKQRKVLAKLKEKLLARHRKEAERDQRKELDEIASVRFVRQSAGGEVA